MDKQICMCEHADHFAPEPVEGQPLGFPAGHRYWIELPRVERVRTLSGPSSLCQRCRQAGHGQISSAHPDRIPLYA